MQLIVAPVLPSPLAAPVSAESARAPVRVALVQMRWHADPAEHVAELDEGIRLAAAEGAEVVFLPELTLRRYPGDTPATGRPVDDAEDLHDGPTATFAREAAMRHELFVHASLYERPAASMGIAGDPRGFNTAILASPTGEIVAATRKTHIPISAGYYEDTYFQPGPSADAYPVHDPAGLEARLGLPTCWDEWFPEVSRSYALAGAEVLAYPTAIGSEPTFPDFDTSGIWRHVIVANGITSGLFMVVPNRWGDEGDIAFYGSSFISDPFGRILAEAPRDASAVLVADLDIAQREEWLRLFPFLLTRRPDTYGALVAPVDPVANGYGAVEAAAASSSPSGPEASGPEASGPEASGPGSPGPGSPGPGSSGVEPSGAGSAAL
ncbi:N-carbamoylputrescine amidase [Frondihabitans sp. PhB188]|uniref:nitrilase-related carbon-nitrogen hydrolase n=1 Tax=Frondihabitans sp. PhB188 TaxID=2485200 RepID=UPI000F490065|nr:nitrilase-related carbon-nitrogen hydrolase [Frondihabitans sp. PhB188]ROQ39645.1 N-carbamoylputrescine amidase [Frondihabitans sp. PhB188]